MTIRRRSAPRGTRLITVLVALLLLPSAGCSEDSSGPQAGDALLNEADFIWGKNNLPRDQRFVLMLNEVVNGSAEPLTIQSIEPLSEPDPAVATLEDIRLTPRGGEHPSVALADHLSYPPSHRERDGDCVVKEVVAATGYELPPFRKNEEDAVMVSIIRTNGPGKTSFEIGRVTYEHNGDTFYEDIRLEIELRVRDKEPPEISADDLPCRDLAHLIPQPPTPFSP